MHHVGSATPETVAALAARHEASTDVPADPARLADYFRFTDFAHFITVYLSVVDLIRTPEDVWTLTHDIGVGLADQNVRYAELTLTPYSSVTRGIAAEAFCEAVEDARRAVEAEHDLTLRWCFDIPGESGVPAARPDPGAGPAAASRRPGQLRPRRPGDRRTACLVRAALRAGPGGRPAQRAPRRGVDRPRDGLGRHPAPGRRANRPRHQRDPRPRPGPIPGRGADPPRDLPDVERLHPLRPVAGRSPVGRPRGRRRRVLDRLRRPADVLDHPQPPSTPWPRSCSAWTGPAWPSSPGHRCGSRSPTTDRKRAILGEIDGYLERAR